MQHIQRQQLPSMWKLKVGWKCHSVIWLNRITAGHTASRVEFFCRLSISTEQLGGPKYSSYRVQTCIIQSDFIYIFYRKHIDYNNKRIRRNTKNMDTKDKELPIRLQPTSNKPPDTKEIIIIIKINKIK